MMGLKWTAILPATIRKKSNPMLLNPRQPQQPNKPHDSTNPKNPMLAIVRAVWYQEITCQQQSYFSLKKEIYHAGYG
jgi:hypothetical protein